jgi:hypothetical protein
VVFSDQRGRGTRAASGTIHLRVRAIPVGVAAAAAAAGPGLVAAEARHLRLAELRERQVDSVVEPVELHAGDVRAGLGGDDDAGLPLAVPPEPALNARSHDQPAAAARPEAGRRRLAEGRRRLPERVLRARKPPGG